MGARGAFVIAVGAGCGLRFLPALLSIIGPGVHRLYRGSLTGRRYSVDSAEGFWSGLAKWVMKRPVVVLVPTVAFLVVATTPFFALRMANGDVDMLPPHLESRQGFDHLKADFPGQDQTSFSVVVNYPDGSPLTASRIADQIALEKRMAAIPDVLRTSSIYDLDPSLTTSHYQALYTGDQSKIPAGARQLMAGLVGKHIVVLQAYSNATVSSDDSRNIVKAMRADQGVGGGGELLIGAQTAVDIDGIRIVVERTPLAV